MLSRYGHQFGPEYCHWIYWSQGEGPHWGVSSCPRCSNYGHSHEVLTALDSCTEVLAPTLCDILQQVSGSHKSTSIHTRAATWWVVCIGDGAWSPYLPQGIGQHVLLSSLVHGRSEQENVSTWHVELDWNCKTYVIIIAFLLHWDMLKVYFCQFWSCCFFLSHHNNQPPLVHVFLMSPTSLPSFIFFNLAEWHVDHQMSFSHVITFVKLWHEDPVPPHYDVFLCPTFSYTLNVFLYSMYTIP